MIMAKYVMLFINKIQSQCILTNDDTQGIIWHGSHLACYYTRPRGSALREPMTIRGNMARVVGKDT